MFRNVIKKSNLFLLNSKNKNKFFHKCPHLFLVFACIYLIKYKSNLYENLFLKKVIAMLITLEFLKNLLQNLTLNFLDQTSKI